MGWITGAVAASEFGREHVQSLAIVCSPCVGVQLFLREIGIVGVLDFEANSALKPLYSEHCRWSRWNGFLLWWKISLAAIGRT
jgi:hypothetical protein